MAENKKSLEEKFQNLDETIEKLENKDISLEDSFKFYKEGMELLKECNDEIDEIEKKVKLLSDDGETNDF